MPHLYEEFLKDVQRPARYVGGEYGCVVKDPGSVDARMCLAFPDTYEIGMSHLGMKILYATVNRHPRLAAERAFSPWPDLEAQLRERRLPLVSLETGTPLCDFDVVGFSLQFELTYTNVLAMLDLGGIPLRQKDRTEKDPLVIAGGPTATHPEPLAPFLDAVVIGDGEDVLTDLLVADAAWRALGLTRDERLLRLAGLPGMYIPSLYRTRIDGRSGLEVVDRPTKLGVPLRVDRAFVEDLDRHPFPSDGPVPAAEAVFDRVSVEIARGCTEGCRFCQAGMIYRPVRERSPDSIVKTIVEGVEKGGFDAASLTSLSTADHSCVAPLVKRVVDELSKRRVSLGISSLRAYGLGEDTLDDVARAGASGLTFAPEAGTQRMRDVVNKNVTEEQLMQTAERVFSRGWARMKLYFMIGLPTETDDDVHGIAETGARAVKVGRRTLKGRPPVVVVSVSTHVPKPHTPFQWAAMDTLAEVERKQRMLRDASRGTGIDLKCHDADGSLLEGAFARGDRRLGDVLERAYRKGCRFDSWDEHLRLDLWRAAFEEEGVDPGKYLGTIPVDAALPWDHLDVGLEDGFLLAEYRKSLASRLSPPCGKPVGAFVHHTNLADANADARKLVCYDCGIACDMDRMREERIDWLQSLGAKEPVIAAERPTRAVRPKPTTDFPQGEPVRWRLSFAKEGPAVYLGHLDLQRHVIRTLRRAGIEVAYSQGFHPKPRIVFATALPLGVAGLEEWMDAVLAAPPSVADAEVAELLTSFAPAGVRFLSARRLQEGERAISRAMSSSESIVAGPRGAIDFSAIARGEAVTVVRRSPRGEKSIDVARWFVSARRATPTELRAAGLPDVWDGAWVVLRLSGDGGTRAEEAVEGLGAGTGPFKVVRVRLQLEAPQVAALSPAA